MKISIQKTNKILGLGINEKELAKLLKKMGYDYKNGTALIAPWRIAVLSAMDIIEDVAIAYGYENLPAVAPTVISYGCEKKSAEITKKIAELLIGLGFQEVATPTLTSEEVLFKKMGKNEETDSAIKVSNPVSELYTALRPELLSSILSFLSKNITSAYPQKIFEVGTTVNKNAQDKTKLCVSICHKDATVTEIKQILDYLARNLSFNYALKTAEKKEYIQGRAASILKNGKEIGHFGEIAPQIIRNFGIEFPVSAMEMEIDDF